MSHLLGLLGNAVKDTLVGVVPIAVILVTFQLLVLRRPIPQLGRVLGGVGLVIVGMMLFLTGLGEALFPLGRAMADQLTDPELVGGQAAGLAPDWRDYYWVYIFGAAIGFATTIAEPALIAVSMKAQDVSAGTVHAWGLRVAVAVGVAIGISVGCLRIVTGTPLPWYIIVGYVVVVIQAFRAPSSFVQS